MVEYGTFGNGEFLEVVRSILDELYQKSHLEEDLLSDEDIMHTTRIRNGISSKQIPDIIGRATGLTEFNCYPGYPSNTCYQTAFFVSLNSKSITKGKEHLHFQKIIKCLKEHMLLKCERITRNAIIVTDSWNARTASSEQNYIDKIKSQANVELYFFTFGPVFFITRVPL